ncbi:MAG: ABC transporter ATP-binding protein [Patescibacteria group bacterium]|nr:ABC transporter ATP-binding protein [Patescibacteria group bacterium]
MLKIENLSVKIGTKTILRNINLEIKKGEIHALLGLNASGKSTLVNTIAGNSAYKVTSGKIFFDQKDITNLPAEERTKLGIAVCFQHPPVIRGLKLHTLLEKISNEKVEIVPEELMKREVNVDFSGGERKLAEIAQIIALKPKFILLDELDSGLDLENLKKLTEIIKDKFLRNGVSILLISHHGEIFRFLKPDFVHVMLNGKMLCTSNNMEKIWSTIKKYGYEKCKECPLQAD